MDKYLDSLPPLIESILSAVESNLVPIVVVMGLVIVFGLIWSLIAGGRQGSREVAEIGGRLQQMAENQAATQALLSEQLRQQERAVADALDLRLNTLSKQVGDRLQSASSLNQSALIDLRERLAVIDRAQKNITDLSSQVVGLQDILSNKQARGSFGELQLNDLVESLLPPGSYEFQATLGNNRRADCLLKLPNPPGVIAIDSKFPLESYEALRQAEDDSATTLAKRSFSSDLRTHLKHIAERYIVPGETAESALMFLPSESVYAEVHANFRGIVEESHRLRVWIVSPTTLMATLTTVRAVLKDVHMHKQAGVIQTEVAHLLNDIGRLDERVAKLQRHYEQSGEDIRQIRISTEKVTRRGQRIEEFEVIESESVEEAIEPQQKIASIR